MEARWRFIELPANAEINIASNGLSIMEVEYLSINFTFGGSLERCWYWFHNGQIEVNEVLYSSTSEKEILDWMSDLDTNYQTTKFEKKQALLGLINFNNKIIAEASELNIQIVWQDGK